MQYMALIAENHPASSGSPDQFWKDELDNSRILLFELDKAIYTLSQKGIYSYSINTGQDIQNVTRYDLPQLYTRRKDLMKQIEELELKLGITKPEISAYQVTPVW